MAQIKKNGNLPINARCNIKYGKNVKPTISFSYISKKRQNHGSLLPYMMMLMLVVGLIINVAFEITPNKLTWFLIPLIGYFVVAPIIYFPFRNYWDKFYPQVQSSLSKKKFRIFYKKDVMENVIDKDKAKYYVEIPIFANVILDFKTKGEFNDYLEEIDIKEYNFKYFKKSKLGKRFYHKFNEGIWYGRFYFTNKPTTGELYVMFR